MTNYIIAPELVSGGDFIDDRLDFAIDDYLLSAVGAALNELPSPSNTLIENVSPDSCPPLTVFGVTIDNFAEPQAVELMQDLINDRTRSRNLFCQRSHAQYCRA